MGTVEPFSPNTKVWVPSDQGMVPLVSERVFELESVKGVERLVVSAPADWCGLILVIMGEYSGPYKCLYEVRDAEADASTESGHLTPDKLQAILAEFKQFLETDPRHNFWVYDFPSRTQVVLDEHNFLFLYGDLDRLVDWLEANRFSRGKIAYPTPHVHRYYPEFDSQEALLVQHLTSTT